MTGIQDDFLATVHTLAAQALPTGSAVLEVVLGDKSGFGADLAGWTLRIVVMAPGVTPQEDDA